MLQLIATPAVLRTIAEDSRVLPVTQAFAVVQTVEIALGEPTPLDYRDGTPSGLTIEMKAVRGDPPRFARKEEVGHTVAAFIRTRDGKTCAFVPGCGGLGPKLLARLDEAELLLFDGTFWTDDELIRLGISDRPASAMGHVADLGRGREPRAAVATRLSPEGVHAHQQHESDAVEDRRSARTVEAAGMLVGMDGMRFEI